MPIRCGDAGRAEIAPRSPDGGDCTAHLHWADKTDRLEVQPPVDAALNQDEDAANGGDNETDPADGDAVGQAHIATNFWTDLDCSTRDDLKDGGTYDITWEDTWTSYTVPSGWTKVAEYGAVVETVSTRMHVTRNDSTGQYVIVMDLPATLTCDSTPTNLRMHLFSHVDNDPILPVVAKNPTTAGCYTVTASAILTTGVSHTDDATISVGGATC